MRLFIVMLCAVVMTSCKPYKKLSGNYTFRTEDGLPRYNDLDYWAAHPWKWDPADSIPDPLRQDGADSTVDVFFLHPTSYTKRKIRGMMNAPVDDPGLNAKTDYTSILYQASAFNANARVFAPRYRQAFIKNFFRKDSLEAMKVFDIAYQDVKKAFLYYLENWNGGRPIVMASHSQGAFLMNRLLKELFEGKPLQRKLVVAYVIGWHVSKNYFSTLPMCQDSLQTGCVISWRTLKKGFVPYFLRHENGNALVTNPLHWKTTGEYAPRTLNKGSLLRDFNKIYLHTTDAWISNGFLYVHKPKFPWSFLFTRRNYHIADINLFYVNLREDVRRRIGYYWKP
jgi:hypothetical protein